MKAQLVSLVAVGSLGVGFCLSRILKRSACKVIRFRKLLNAGKLIILDGGLATELENNGADLSDSLWSARLIQDDPKLIRSTHISYYLAGADVSISASYQGTIEGFIQHFGLSRQKAAALLKSSVAIACEGRDMAWEQIKDKGCPGRGPLLTEKRFKPMVAASIGCYGAYLADGSEYRGQYELSVDKLKSFHRSRLELLAAAGADLISLETIPCVDEAIALLELLEEPAIQKLRVPAYLSMACKDGVHLNSGESMEMLMEAIKQHLENDLLVAVGVNCTAPQHVEELLGIMAAHTTLPLLVYANSGEEWDSACHTWHPGTAILDDAYVEYTKKWFKCGARIIGGCCRTTPETISKIRKAFRGM